MTNVLSEKCPSCTATLKYDAIKDIFQCEYCHNIYTLAQLEEYKKMTNSDSDILSMPDMNGYHCSNCGAEIIVSDNISSTSCVYCKSTAILKNRLTGLYAPSKIITFQYTKQDATQTFMNKCKGRLLLPKQFNDPKNIQEMEGLYVPFWLYDCENQTFLQAKCTRVSHWSDFRYSYTKTDYYDVLRNGLLTFYKVPADASSRFDDCIMNAIEPFDYGKFKDFNMSYLSGYISEKYDVDKDVAYRNAKNRVEDDSTQFLFDTIKGYSTKVRIKSSNVITQNKTYYVLLPVWVLNIKFKNKIYHFAMNGQTGKMVGEIPVDTKKLLLTIVCSFMIPFVIMLIYFLCNGYRW